MSTVSKSFTAVADGPERLVKDGESISYAVSGTFVATLFLQQFDRGGWTTLASLTDVASATVIISAANKKPARVRFRCNAFTSGTAVTSLTDVTSEVSRSITDADGNPVINVTQDGPVIPSGKTFSATSPNLSTPMGAVACVEATFTESGAGTYTGSVAVPAGATLLDIIVSATALWAAGTSAALDVGDVADPNGYYTAINLKATDLLAGSSVSFSFADGNEGAYITTQVSPRYSATARVISGIVTSVGAGTTGRTRMTVLYALPVTADIIAAVQT